ncbi:MAG: type II toxin-antitoxin system PemK/MazF family toxin [Mycobacterium sp.]
MSPAEPLPQRLSPGDIVLVYFPYSRHEREPYKKRPVLVLSHIGLNEDEAIGLVMITGNEERFTSQGAGDIRIDRWQDCRLAKRSVIRTRRIWTARYWDLAGKVGTLQPTSLLDHVRDAVRNTLAL